jgi:hypothetical protein
MSVRHRSFQDFLGFHILHQVHQFISHGAQILFDPESSFDDCQTARESQALVDSVVFIYVMLCESGLTAWVGVRLEANLDAAAIADTGINAFANGFELVGLDAENLRSATYANL